MTKARDLSSIIGSSGQIDNAKITLDANEIPALDTAKITTGTFDASRIGSGTFADARISASSVSQHATSFDDNKIVNDISTLALRQASDQNKSAYNTNSSFVDVFQDSTGIDTTTNASRNDSEYVASENISFSTPAIETGDFSNTYSITGSGFGIEDGSLSNWLNNVYTSGNSSSGFYWSSATQGTSVAGANITIQFPSAKIVTGIRQYQDNNQLNGIWKIQGSNDGSNFTDLSANFDWGGNQTVVTSTERYTTVNWNNDTPYTYIRVLGISGLFNYFIWQTELQFQTKTKVTTVNATGNFTGTTITAPSSVSSMGAIITYQDQSGTNALNTDIVLELSADNGSNWSTATLSALPNFATGIKMAKVNDLAVTAGTQLKYRINFANQASGSKEARIRGVALQY